MPYEVYIGAPMKAVAEGTLTVGASAVGIPADQLDKVKGGETELLLGIETDQVRASFLAGGAPSTGTLFDVGDKLRVAGSPTCRDLRLIQVTASATVRYTVFSKAI